MQRFFLWGAVRTGVLLSVLGPAGCGREAERSTGRQPASLSGAGAGPALGAPDSAAAEPQAASGAADRGPAPTASVGVTPITAAGLRSALQLGRGQKATLVNAWASWCGPCRREVPMLQALSVNLELRGVQILLVSVDSPADASKAAAFLTDNRITLQSYIVEGSLSEFKAGINPRWPGMLPASFLFDAAGQLRHFWGGEAFENEILPVVDGFLAGSPIKSETRYGLAAGKLSK